MSRPLRIEFPNACYHVMNRGRRAENIFIDSNDYKAFVDMLKETAVTWNIKVAAYCLISNHDHNRLKEISDFASMSQEQA